MAKWNDGSKWNGGIQWNSAIVAIVRGIRRAIFRNVQTSRRHNG